ncbi:hypothetical protein CR155_06740 [Pollutimonas nitritireducens]|uniref:Uncharacterized protein n=1 Tax=Pollutimonas nitritireducens TaxID=2045209 RepID=A0A2N4UHJ2_9BURK|nr:hypothetical protein [Pollutimonas nitritireducens]PLC54470.1 hypothetical protein CR155_06740 [Pollutimonas nitritireducens]
MKQLASKPFFLALLMSVPLWIVFNNFIVAIMVALLVAFLISMCYSLYTIKQGKPAADERDSSIPPSK